MGEVAAAAARMASENIDALAPYLAPPQQVVDTRPLDQRDQ
jgi:hypothetical protein